MQNYIRAKFIITEFDVEDIITTSGAPSPDSSDQFVLPDNGEDITSWGF